MVLADGCVAVAVIVGMRIGMAGGLPTPGGPMFPAVAGTGPAHIMIAAGISGAVGSAFMISVTTARTCPPAAGATLEGGCIVMAAPGVRRPAVVMCIAIMCAGRTVPAVCLVHREPRSGQGMIGMVDALDGGDRVEPGALKGRDERRLQLRPGIEHRCREHVAGDPADGIKLDVHGDIVSRAHGPHTRRTLRCGMA